MRDAPVGDRQLDPAEQRAAVEAGVRRAARVPVRADLERRVEIDHHEVIVRNRGALQYLGREDLFAFDKTGTITLGEFSLLEGLELSRHLNKQF